MFTGMTPLLPSDDAIAAVLGHEACVFACVTCLWMNLHVRGSCGVCVLLGEQMRVGVGV